MRRPVLPLLVCLLALATGLALLGASALVAVPAPPAAPTPRDADEATLAPIRRFYDAVDAALRTGEPDLLADAVAPGFADRTVPPGHAPTRDGLVRHLLALRATFPALRLSVAEVRSNGAWVLARLRLDGAGRGVVVGVPVTGTPESWEAIELLRVAGGRIAERRTTGDWPVLPRPLVKVPLPRPPAAAFVRLGRLTYGPGATQPRTAALGPLLVAVERGALTVAVEGEAVLARAGSVDASTPPRGDVLLGAGDAIVLPAGARYALRNAGPAPAVVLTLGLHPWSAGAPDRTVPAGQPPLWREAWLPDVTAQLLAEGAVEALPEGPATLGLGRVALAAGAELVAHGAGAPRLAAVEAGTLQVATADGPAAILAAGQGTLVAAGAAPAFRNAGDGSLVVLLATITPGAPTTGHDAADHSGDAPPADATGSVWVGPPPRLPGRPS